MDRASRTPLTRRSVLLLALAAAGCGRPRAAQPRRAPAAVRLDVAVQMQVPAGGATARALYQRAKDVAAWFAPVVLAFNASHPQMRAVSVPEILAPAPRSHGMIEAYPRASVLVGAGAGGLDLRGALKAANADLSALLPGAIAGVTQASGAVEGIPVDFAIEEVLYDSRALAAAGLAGPPPAGWTLAQMLALVEGLAQRRAVFGADLAFAPYNVGPAWLGFALGYGGSVFAGGRLALTAPRVLEGLNAYGRVLQNTWGRRAPGVVGALAFEQVSGVHRGAHQAAALRRTRFPRMPLAQVVPAALRCATAPMTAPHRREGAIFAVWLVSAEGQRALTALGFPAMRADASDRGSWLSGRGAQVRRSQLRFLPGVLTGGLAASLELDVVVTNAVALAAGARRAALARIEAQVNAFLARSAKP